MKKRTIIKAISMILSFFLAFFIVVLSMLICLKATFLSEDYMLNQIQKCGYDNLVRQEIEEYYVSYGIPSGFDETFFRSVLDNEKIKKDITAQVNAIYQNQNFGFDKNAFKQDIYNKLEKNAIDRGYKIDTSTRDSLLNLAEICSDTYETNIIIPLSSNIKSLVTTINKYIIMAFTVSLIAIFIIIFLIMKLHLKKIKIFSYLIYSLGASFIMIGIPLLIISLGDYIKKIAIESSSLYNFVTSYLYGISEVLMFICFVLIIIYLFLIAIYFILRGKYKSP